MPEIRLTPTGYLCWEAPESHSEPGRLSALREVFCIDWRYGLFTLAAEKIGTGASLTLHYWQGVAARYLTALCHIPGSTEKIEVEPPSPAECATLVLTAPPMQGGEYLTAEALLTIWNALDRWAREAIRSAGGLDAFLAARAPRWHQVGRVCFHLAENKNDQARPFAFLATYATGFGAGGRLKHLPLRKALEQYAGAKNRSALIKLLAPVQQAAERCEWVMRLVDFPHVIVEPTPRSFLGRVGRRVRSEPLSGVPCHCGLHPPSLRAAREHQRACLLSRGSRPVPGAWRCANGG